MASLSRGATVWSLRGNTMAPPSHSRSLPSQQILQTRTFATESPFHLARRIPKDTWKTVTDAWNGYHSVSPSPIRPAPYDVHHTLWRMAVHESPQGFLSSGDGYNRRFDAVLAHFECKERCVDDTIHYDTALEQHWWRTIDFLTRVGQAGIVLNPDKFQFAQKTVDFAGFRVSDSSIEPLPKYLDAIRDFPTPTSTTDIRSWFGLVNQVGNYAQLRDTMAPFKPFLIPRHKFSWSAEMDTPSRHRRKPSSRPSAKAWRFSISHGARACAPIGPTEALATSCCRSTATALPMPRTAAPKAGA